MIKISCKVYLTVLIGEKGSCIHSNISFPNDNNNVTQVKEIVAKTRPEHDASNKNMVKKVLEKTWGTTYEN